MTDKEKLEPILTMMTDQNVGVLVKSGAIHEGDEEFGALVFATHTFNKAYKLVRK